MLWRELRVRYEDYFEGGMGAESIQKLIDRIDLDSEEIKLRAMIDAADGRKPLSAQRRQKVIRRPKIVTAFNRRDENAKRVNDPRAMTWRCSRSFDLRVDVDITAAREEFQKLFPNEQIEVTLFQKRHRSLRPRHHRGYLQACRPPRLGLRQECRERADLLRVRWRR